LATSKPIKPRPPVINTLSVLIESPNLESPFSAEIHSDYTALQQYGNGKAGIPVERQSDSVPPWTRPCNQEPSLSISRTLFPPPFSSAI
jgi:hypothetical protein